MKPLRIYIAGPYSGIHRNEIEKNVASAIDAGIEVFLKGHFPYVPHLTDLIDQRANQIGKPLSWHDFIRWDMPWLEACDAFLYLGKSKGADLELEEAKRLKKKIFYSLDEIPDLMAVETTSD
ncbi:MAG: DUF4406 domain-containing protein [Nitrososphaera sp.]|nr:DUF4406 domain-containing protein [Nitrososphaera sp.]